LIGSIPTGFIFVKVLKGEDIREHGSGNIGATNVFRVLGKGPGITVLLIDIIKGIIPLTLVANLLGITIALDLILLALAAVAGHNWTVFLKFKGGKGIATTLGVLIGLTIQIAAIRPVLGITLLTWIISFLISGIVSLSSILASIILPITMLGTSQSIELICLGVVFCVFVVFRHRPNIKRLLAGEEPRVKLPFRK